MITARTKIRPRLRTAESASVTSALALAEPSVTRTSSDDAMPLLPVLARLPEVTSPFDHTKLSLRLDWLKRLDWQQVRRIKLDPNWVAGGVLSLVLLLLLVITFNRGAKPAAEPQPQGEAPAWNSAGNIPPSSSPAGPTVGASVSWASKSADSNEQVTYQGQPVGAALSAQAAGPGDSSLTGVYYPQTPHPAFAPPSPGFGTAPQPSGQPGYGDEIRTAQRDVITPVRSPVQVASPQSAQAHFQGIITNPE